MTKISVSIEHQGSKVELTHEMKAATVTPDTVRRNAAKLLNVALRALGIEETGTVASPPHVLAPGGWCYHPAGRVHWVNVNLPSGLPNGGPGIAACGATSYHWNNVAPRGSELCSTCLNLAQDAGVPTPIRAGLSLIGDLPQVQGVTP